MASIFSDNISFIGKKSNFERDTVKDVAALLAVDPANEEYDYGHIVFCEEDGKHYQFNYNYDNPAVNSRNDTTGWFTELATGGGASNIEISYDESQEALNINTNATGGGGGSNTGGGNITVDEELSNTSINPVQNKVITEALEGKQEKLVSGTNIKTINNQPIIGSGNINITPETTASNPLRSLYIAAGAEYNDTNVDKTKTTPWGETVTHKAGYYYLNGFGDISEDEMAQIYNAGKYWLSADANGVLSNIKGRTNIPPEYFTNYYYKTFKLSQAVNNSNYLEVLVLSTLTPNLQAKLYNIKVSEMVFFGQGAVKLKRIVGNFDITNCSATVNPPNIEYINFVNLNKNFNLQACSKLSKESLIYMIQNAIATTNIIITLHNDVYLKCQEGGEWYSEIENVLDTKNKELTGNIDLATITV